MGVGQADSSKVYFSRPIQCQLIRRAVGGETSIVFDGREFPKGEVTRAQYNSWAVHLCPGSKFHNYIWNAIAIDIQHLVLSNAEIIAS